MEISTTTGRLSVTTDTEETHIEIGSTLPQSPTVPSVTTWVYKYTDILLGQISASVFVWICNISVPNAERPF